MRKYLKFNILGLVLIVMALVSCDQASQDVEPVIDPGTYPVATFTTSFTGSTVTEGDTIKYTISVDKQLDRALTFDVKLTGGTADEHDIITNAPVVLAPYTSEIELYIIIARDNFPEVTETLEMEIGVFGIAEKHLLNPSTVNPKPSVSITNYNRPDRFTIALGWTTVKDDLDLFAISADYGDWGLAGSSDNPEIMMDIWPDDPDGVYYITIDPYHVYQPTVNYTFSIGHPNQTVQFFSGVFDYTNRNTAYTIDYFAYWGVNTYRLLEVTNSGGTFTVVHVNE